MNKNLIIGIGSLILIGIYLITKNNESISSEKVVVDNQVYISFIHWKILNKKVYGT